MNNSTGRDIKKFQELLILEVVEKLAKDKKFVKRKSKLDAEKFLSLCVFLEEELCKSSLSEICSTLEIEENIKISPEGLNNRFNSEAVEFMKAVFMEIFQSQSKILRDNQEFLKTYFNRIKVADSTVFKLPKEFIEHYKGTGGSASESSIKIQLEYNILSGEFLNCDNFSGVDNDNSYLPTLQNDIKPNDLCLKDLGYSSIDDLEYISTQNAYYISKLRGDITTYIKNTNNKNKSEYCKINILELAEPLGEGETLEVPEVYLSRTHKAKSRLIITKLNETDKSKKMQKHLKSVNKGRGTINEKSVKRNEISICITNVPHSVLNTENVYKLYSLRWQIELMFKVWKSIFKIHLVKKVKFERFLCFLYGKLIALVIASSIVFMSKKIIYRENNKEISEYKAFSITNNYMKKIRRLIFVQKDLFIKLIYRIINSILNYGIKCIKKGKKIPSTILKSIEIT